MYSIDSLGEDVSIFTLGSTRYEDLIKRLSNNLSSQSDDDNKKNQRRNPSAPSNRDTRRNPDEEATANAANAKNQERSSGKEQGDKSTTSKTLAANLNRAASEAGLMSYLTFSEKEQKKYTIISLLSGIVVAMIIVSTK